MSRKAMETAAGSDDVPAAPIPVMPRPKLHDWWQIEMVDHGVLRHLWTNFDEVAPGVFRSNHPGPARLRAYRDHGVRSVINLRGANLSAGYRQEVQTCAALGLDLFSIKLTARGTPRRERLQDLFASFDTIARPFLMHCKSGADRAGLASVLYLLDQGEPVVTARRHLSRRYLHLGWTRTGILDAFVDVYARRLETGPISVRDWVRDEYDPAAVQALFDQRRTLGL